MFWEHYFDCLAQDCSNSIANALELLQSFTKPVISYLAVCYIWVQFSCYYWVNFFQFLIFPFFFSNLRKHSLPNEYHIHIWQVYLQISCGGSCQI